MKQPSTAFSAAIKLAMQSHELDRRKLAVKLQLTENAAAQLILGDSVPSKEVETRLVQTLGIPTAVLRGHKRRDKTKISRSAIDLTTRQAA